MNGAECCARWLVLEDVDRVPAEANLKPAWQPSGWLLRPARLHTPSELCGLHIANLFLDQTIQEH